VTWAAVGAMTTVILAAIGLMSFWIARSLDRIDARLDRIEERILVDYGERIARLEERVGR
jgi:hypothetical protein